MKIIGTTKISYEIENILENSTNYLIIVSPYLKINKRLKVILSDAFNRTEKIIFVYRENQLDIENKNWLKSFENLNIYSISNLHSKIYMNQDFALITSMNLYEYSQINNHEIGVTIKNETNHNEFTEILSQIRLIIESEYDENPLEEFKLENDYTMGRLFEELNKNYTFKNYRPNSQYLYEFISNKSRQIVEINDYELYQDKSAILRSTILGRNRYNELKSKLLMFSNE